MSGDHPNDSIIEDGLNTEKSPGDLRRLVVTQSPVKAHQLTLMLKTLMCNNNNDNNINEKKDKYLDLARELKKLWNMQVTIVLIVIDAFGTVTKRLLKGLEDLEVGG